MDFDDKDLVLSSSSWRFFFVGECVLYSGTAGLRTAGVIEVDLFL